MNSHGRAVCRTRKPILTKSQEFRPRSHFSCTLDTRPHPNTFRSRDYGHGDYMVTETTAPRPPSETRRRGSNEGAAVFAHCCSLLARERSLTFQSAASPRRHPPPGLSAAANDFLCFWRGGGGRGGHRVGNVYLGSQWIYSFRSVHILFVLQNQETTRSVVARICID